MYYHHVVGIKNIVLVLSTSSINFFSVSKSFQVFGFSALEVVAYPKRGLFCYSFIFCFLRNYIHKQYKTW